MDYHTVRLITCLKELFPPQFHDRVFLVGGSVRDLMVGRAGNDLDLSAALSPAEFTACGFHLVTGRSTSPIWFRHLPELGTVEVTPLTDCAELMTDLSRRDFTINAIAMDMTGILIDPLDGSRDLQQRLLRTCTPDSFGNDPLRIFRALRFEADGWRMTADCEALIRDHEWDAALLRIPVERFSHEMVKALGLNQPELFFRRMLELKVGRGFLPEIFCMPHIPAGPLIHHPEGDLFTHCCQVLQRVTARTDDPLTRFCSFFHDIGKLATDPAHYPEHHGHDQAGFEMARAFCDRLRLPACYRTALAWTSRLHGTLNLWDNLRDATRMRIAEQALKAGVSKILPLVSAADKADWIEHNGWRDAVRIAGMTTAELGIEATGLEKMPDSTRSGYILQKRVEQFRASTNRAHKAG